MPTPTIPDGELFFNATTYTGNGGTQTITNGNPGQSFQPDFLWVKERSEARSNLVWDSVRGSNLGLITNTTSSESAQPSFTGFVSNGFGVSNADSSDITNKNAQTYVAWQWKAGGAAVTNTAGSISAQVSANTTSGFSVVTYTGNATAGATVGHGLGVAPSMIITKNRDSSTDWWVYHASLGNTKYLVLNTTAAEATSSSAWNNTSPTSTVFSLGAANPSNANQDVAYCWSEIAGFSKFGSYTGNGSTDGPFVYTGFRPRFILMKASSAVEQWTIWDSSRLGYNPFQAALFPNAASAEDATASGSNSNGGPDFLSNGFKMRSNGGSNNNSGVTYIYYAVAENPFKYANAR